VQNQSARALRQRANHESEEALPLRTVAGIFLRVLRAVTADHRPNASSSHTRIKTIRAGSGIANFQIIEANAVGWRTQAIFNAKVLPHFVYGQYLALRIQQGKVGGQCIKKRRLIF